MNTTKKTNKSLSLDEDVIAYYENLAKESGRSFSNYVNHYLRQRMEKEKVKTNPSSEETETTETTEDKTTPW